MSKWPTAPTEPCRTLAVPATSSRSGGGRPQNSFSCTRRRVTTRSYRALGHDRATQLLRSPGGAPGRLRGADGSVDGTGGAPARTVPTALAIDGEALGRSGAIPTPRGLTAHAGRFGRYDWSRVPRSALRRSMPVTRFRARGRRPCRRSPPSRPERSRAPATWSDDRRAPEGRFEEPVTGRGARAWPRGSPSGALCPSGHHIRDGVEILVARPRGKDA
jgi:hypothetical protein